MDKPKFKIGNIVQMEDKFHFNPCEKVTSIGRIEAIHIKQGKELGYNPRERKSPKKLNHIIYTVSGFSLMPHENQLKIYKED